MIYLIEVFILKVLIEDYMTTIVFEGLDYSGKSSIIKTTESYLRSQNLVVNRLAFPSDSYQPLVKAAFKNHDSNAKALMMAISTLFGIKDNQKISDVTLTDRHFLSCFAYNCVSNKSIRDIFDTLKTISEFDDTFIKVDYLFYFECDLDTIKERFSNREKVNEDYKNNFDQNVVNKLSQYKDRYEYALELWNKHFPKTIITRIDTSNGKLNILDSTRKVLSTIYGD